MKKCVRTDIVKSKKKGYKNKKSQIVCRCVAQPRTRFLYKFFIHSVIVERMQNLYNAARHSGVGWVANPTFLAVCRFCWVCNPTYPLWHFFKHFTIKTTGFMFSKAV